MSNLKVGVYLYLSKDDFENKESNSISNQKELYDNFEIDRNNTLDIFKSVEFEIIEEQTWKKFDKIVNGVLVRIVLLKRKGLL